MKNISINKTVKNAGWIVGGRVAQMLVSLVVGLLTARYLGPSNYGVINYAAAYTAFFTAFCTLGINSVLVKEFIDRPDEEGKIIGTSLILRAVSSFLSVIMIMCIVFVVDAGETTTLWVVALSSIGSVFHICEIFNFWFQSKLQSKVTAMTSLAAYILTALYRIVLLITQRNVLWFAFSSSLDYIFVGVFLLIAYKKHGGSRLSFSWDYGKRLLSRSCHFILPSLMVSIYGQTDKIMLKQMMGTEEIGYYSTAVALCNMWCFVLTAIIDSVYPSIMEAHKHDEELFIRRNKQLYAIVFYLSVFVSVLYVIFAELIILVMYGEAYMPSVTPLRIITWYTAFSYLGVARNAWIVSKQQQKYLIVIYASSAFVNVILNFVLIPGLGTAGAALASLITQMVTILVAPLLVKGLRENSKMLIEAIMLRGVFCLKRNRKN